MPAAQGHDRDASLIKGGGGDDQAAMTKRSEPPPAYDHQSDGRFIEKARALARLCYIQRALLFVHQ